MSYFSFAPTGTIMFYNEPTPPVGWMFCDGRAISRTTYWTLWNAIGTSWGSGDLSTTFNIPSLEGILLRGRDGGVGRDSLRTTRTAIATGGSTGDNVGSYQIFSLVSHSHNISGISLQSASLTHSHGVGLGDAAHDHGVTFNSNGEHKHSVDFITADLVNPDGSLEEVLDSQHKPITYDSAGSINNDGVYLDQNSHGATTDWRNAKHYHGVWNSDIYQRYHLHSITINVASNGFGDSRPFNASVAYIIKT